MNILGAVFLPVKGMLPNSRDTLHLFYVADNVFSIYLSLSTLKTLGIVPPDFPMIGTKGQVAGVGVHMCTNAMMALWWMAKLLAPAHQGL